jgi:hypothetical protein
LICQAIATERRNQPFLYQLQEAQPMKRYARQGYRNAAIAICFPSHGRSLRLEPNNRTKQWEYSLSSCDDKQWHHDNLGEVEQELHNLKSQEESQQHHVLSTGPTVCLGEG